MGGGVRGDYSTHLVDCSEEGTKGHVTRGNLSLQLAMQFLPKKILQVAVRMSDVRNLFATCNEIIF